MTIYKIVNNINGKIYIGQTRIKHVYRRWNQHKSYLRRGIHDNKHLQLSWFKYGEETFIFEIVEQDISDLDELNKRESYWITFYNSMNEEKGYNLTSGGGANKIISEETRKKISEANRIKATGRPVSKETRNKLSIANKGKIVSEETKRRMSEARKHLSPEIKAKYKGPKSKETREKMSMSKRKNSVKE